MSLDIQDNEILLAESMPDGIIILDECDNVAWWNKLANYFLGLDLKAYQNKPLESLLTTHVYRNLLRAKTYKYHSPHQLQKWLSMSLHSYRDAQKLLILQDTTHTVNLEVMRQNFVANVSHELRTPLTVFRGYIELLQDPQILAGDRSTEIIKNMDEQCERMERIVEDLLWLVKLENVELDKKQMHKVHVASLLRNITEDAKSLSGANQHEFSLKLDEELYLQGCADELRSAFSNIIYNAVHYTPAKGKIIISCYQDKQSKYVTVSDTGIGIAKKHIPHITERFYRVDKARSSRGKVVSTGLGLAIVKHVLLRHKGKLVIESKVNKGSNFCCAFPLDK